MPIAPTDNTALQEILAAASGAGRAGGQGTTTTSSLPDMVANNPSAYAELLGYQHRDPLSYYDTFSGGPARGLGSSNGLVLYSKPNKREGAAAAVLADIANRQQQQRFEQVLQGRKTRPRSGLGTLGDLGGAAGSYVTDLLKAAYIGGQAGATARGTTPAAETGAGRMGGGGGGLPQSGGGVDWGQMLGAILGSQR